MQQRLSSNVTDHTSDQLQFGIISMSRKPHAEQHVKNDKKEERSMTRIASIAAAAALGFIAFTGTVSTANAAGCYYRLYHDGHGVVTGPLAIQGYASALKVKNACDRARRECNRRFDRARKKGNVPRGGPRDMRCIRTSAG